MNTSLLADAFGHHVWATLRLIDVCLTLTPDQLGAAVPGTFGNILDTLRHLVGADRSYLTVLSGGHVERVDEDTLGLPELRAAMAKNGAVWAWLADQDLDPSAVLVRVRPDGSKSHAPVGIRLAQALHHGTDHRSQVCTALTQLGIQPPEIAWDFAAQDGRLVETPPPG
jgi:uncharacterized damage-inducible protein DinB